jgi:hypothetical protein
MKKEHLTLKSGFGVLVEGPKWGDAEFYGNWLLAAAKAETLWNEASDDPDFAKQVDRLSVATIPHFGIAATVFLMRLKDHLVSFVISFNEGDGVDEFVMMVEMGFFVCSGQSYHMAIPRELSLAKVKAAALIYAQSEDDEYNLHPELVVSSMPLDEALRCQIRHLAIFHFRRDSHMGPGNQSPS